MKGIKKWLVMCLFLSIFVNSTKIVQAYDIKTSIATEMLN